jgi:hypothetical protein
MVSVSMVAESMIPPPRPFRPAKADLGVFQFLLPGICHIWSGVAVSKLVAFIGPDLPENGLGLGKRLLCVS